MQLVNRQATAERQNKWQGRERLAHFAERVKLEGCWKPL